MNPMPQQAEEIDTYTWLLTAHDTCPACGALAPANVLVCASCGLRLVVTVRPPTRSVTAFTLTGAWTIVAMGALMALFGAIMEVIGVTPAANSPEVLRWLIISSVTLALFGMFMTWACVKRRPFALYVGIALTLLLGIAGVGGGLLIAGPLSLSLVIISVLFASALILMHISVVREFIGEQRRLDFAPQATSAIGLYNEGREHYAAGRRFLAAQRWARAIGKDPSNAVYLHALGLVLAQLGHHKRALGQLERAMQAAPDDLWIREGYEVIRHQAHAAENS